LRQAIRAPKLRGLDVPKERYPVRDAQRVRFAPQLLLQRTGAHQDQGRVDRGERLEQDPEALVGHHSPDSEHNSSAVPAGELDEAWRGTTGRGLLFDA